MFERYSVPAQPQTLAAFELDDEAFKEFLNTTFPSFHIDFLDPRAEGPGERPPVIPPDRPRRKRRGDKRRR